MPVSILYKNLRKRVLTLKKQFLNFQPAESVLPENQDQLRAFKLLVHAEIESYIEKSVLEVLNKCINEWKTKKRVTVPLPFLIMFSSSKFEANEKQLTKENRINQILESFKSVVSSNNGIKEKNILKLIVPLGINYSSIDDTRLTTIDSYGHSRGEVAHNSLSAKKQLDKNSELNDLHLVLTGIKKIDIRLQKISSCKKKPF